MSQPKTLDIIAEARPEIAAEVRRLSAAGSSPVDIGMEIYKAFDIKIGEAAIRGWLAAQTERESLRLAQ